MADEHRGLHRLADIRSRRLQQRGDVPERLMGLCLQPYGDLPGLGDDGDLTGSVDQSVHDLCLGIGPDGGGRFVGFYSFHGKHSFHLPDLAAVSRRRLIRRFPRSVRRFRFR